MKRILLCLLLSFYVLTLTAQEKSTTTSQLDKLIENRSYDDDNKLITDSAYQQYLFKKFNGISGTQIKSGRSFGTSAVIDDKSATITGSFKPILSVLYFQPTVSMASKKGFASIFEDNKYSKTLTGGLNFQLFLFKNSSGFDSKTRIKLHNDLRINKLQHVKENKAAIYFRNAADSVIKILKEAQTDKLLAKLIMKYDLESIIIDKPNATESIKEFKKYQKLTDTLEGAELITPGFHEYSIAEQLTKYFDIVKVKDQEIRKVSTRRYLKNADSLQLNALFHVTSINWLSGGANYNHENYDILENGSEGLVRTVDNEYVQFNLAYNHLWSLSNGTRHYMSIAANYKNSRDYNSKNAITAQSISSYSAGNIALQRIDKSYTFYENVPNRRNNIYAEGAYIFFNNSINIGFEAAFRGGVKDVEGDNLGARFGILVPVGEKDKKPLLIEPLVRFKGLSGNLNNFWEDHFVVGFNVSIKLSNYLL